MSSIPEVSVIIPTRNSMNFLGRCLRSLINQNFDRNKYEIILVNDKSTDETKKTITPYLKELVYVENKRNLGLPASLNVGIKKARGQFIVRVDSDDWVHKEYLQILYNFLNLNNEIDAVSCDYYLMDRNQKILSKENCEKKPIGCGVMFRFIQLINIGLYDKKMMSSGDEDLFIRFKKKYEIFRLPIPLYRYIRHKNNMTNNKKYLKKYEKKFFKKHDL
jgi:glycosyltransferase involved in cell wall biosynthesis